jgi:hypothetical protein
MGTAAAGAVDTLESFETRLRAEVFREDAPDGLDALGELAAQTRDELLALSEQRLQLELSADLFREMDGYTLTAVRALNTAAKAETSDAVRRQLFADALVDIEALRHILRDGIDHEPLRTVDADGATFLSRSGAVAQISKWLPRLTAAEQAVLLGLDERQARRWREGGDRPASERAQIVVELVGVLRHSWTNEGVVRWFARRHPMLDDRTPDAVLALLAGDEDSQVDWETRLRDAASATRSMTAT